MMRGENLSPAQPASAGGLGLCLLTNHYWLLAAFKAMQPSLHPDLASLAEQLESAARLLRSCGESHWSAWLERDASMIRSRNFRGVEHFLGAFGGMGSLNDLIISPANGHTVPSHLVDDVNDNLRILLDRAGAIASKLARAEQSAPRAGG